MLSESVVRSERAGAAARIQGLCHLISYNAPFWGDPQKPPLGLLFLHGALSGDSVAQTEAFWGWPIAELVEHWAGVVAFILNLVDEVRELLDRLEQDGVLG